MQAIFWCPLIYLILRGVAKLKGLHDEVLLHSSVCILVFHVEELDILMVGVFSSLSYYQSYLVISWNYNKECYEWLNPNAYMLEIDVLY
jgi:hypothetical protein